MIDQEFSIARVDTRAPPSHRRFADSSAILFLVFPHLRPAVATRKFVVNGGRHECS